MMIQQQQAAMAGEVGFMGMGFWGGDHHHRHNQPEDEDDEDEGFSQDDIMPPWHRSSSISSPLSHKRPASSTDDRDSGDDPGGLELYDYAWPSVTSSDKRRKLESHEADLDSRPSSSSGAPSSPSLPSRSRPPSSGTGSLFFKTKLCIKFSAGTCPYNSSCNFAHGMEELRKPPPGWEEIVAVQDAERTPRNSKETSSQYIISSAGSGNMAESQRFRRTRRCKKFYSEEGCPYGDRCNFLHDDQARARESNAISLGPTTNPAGGGGNGGNSGERPSNWKTRMCNKWELTGHCPFGQKCNFAHGFTELQMYAGSHIESDTGSHSGSGTQSDAKSTRAPSKSSSEAGSLYASTVYSTDGHNVATVKHRSGFLPTIKVQKHVNTTLPNWKGPADEVSTIYGDWIEEDE